MKRTDLGAHSRRPPLSRRRSRLTQMTSIVGLLSALLAAATTTWEISPAHAATCGAETLTGSGTVADPYRVSTPAQLAAIGTGDCDLGKAYRQEADIAVSGSWTPIGTDGAPFTGVYDADDHVVTGMTVTGTSFVGMFGAIEGASISDLTLSGTVSATGPYVGMLAGVATTSAITGVTVTATVSATTTGHAYVGGILGRGYDVTVSGATMNGSVEVLGGERVGGLIGFTAGLTTVRDSTNHAPVDALRTLGGLIGETSGTLGLDRATNTAAITGSSSSIGGLIGFHDAQSSGLNDLHNTGEVIAGSIYAGGLIGQIDDALSIERGTNDGSVTGTDSVGGFIGYSEDDTLVEIRNSINNGDVTASASSSDAGGFIGYTDTDVAIANSTNSARVVGDGDVGGFIGEYDYDDADLVTITSSSNFGDVVGSSDTGGFIGYSDDTTVITDSQNWGAITGSSDVGGLIGDATEDATITDSSNHGSVTGTSSDIGGFIGDSDGNAFITGGSNTAAISGPNNVGGLIGLMTNDVQVTGSINTGTVSAIADDAGGLVGEVDDNLTVAASRSLGPVTGDNNVGGIAGFIISGYTILIDATFVRAAITATTSAAGGLVGQGTDFTITDSYTSGSVTAGTSTAGGIVGAATNGVFINTYSSATVTTPSASGALAASAVGSTVTASFWNAGLSGVASSPIGTAATLSDPATFSSASWKIIEGWAPYVAGTTVWGICPEVNDNTPYLLWEYSYSVCDGSVLVVPPPPASTSRSTPQVVVGENPTDEASGAVAVSRLVDYAPVVFLISRDAPADALVAAAGGANAGGPVLVTDIDTVPPATLTEIERLGAVRIVIVGGTQRISTDVETFLRNRYRPATVERLAGEDRSATAVDVTTRQFRASTGVDVVYLAASDAPADAVIAAAQGAPVLYTHRTSIPEVTQGELTRLNPDRIVIVGGPVRVAASVLVALSDAFPNADVSRFGGGDRYETAALLADTARTRVMLVDGRLERVDSITPAAVANLIDTTLLLTRPTCAPIPTSRLLESRTIVNIGDVGTRPCS